MAFDKPTRNKLQKLVATCRQLLIDEFTAQLQSLFGIQPDGLITDIDAMQHLDDDDLTTATLLRERLEHLKSGVPDAKKPMVAAIDRLLREQAFTILNRFAAMRMCEGRGIIQEAITNGINSKGFRVYLSTAGSGLGNTYHRYKTFIYCVWDELAVDLGILFDRYSPFGLLFPREKSLEVILDKLNDTQIVHLWQEDETIGWIYQYFNSKEEREKMRKASQAPRNSRELAVRNQFFTPRYVVEFLTDNTMGRIWYEMTKGQTVLTEQCNYLVRRPTEIFLAKNEEAPDTKNDDTDKTQDELLKQPVYIPHRELKDPRDITMLDPACGSMHFGLYAFDLYELIYEEAWDNYPELFVDLRKEIDSKNEFLKRMPELIIRHNIHGIDIDSRAVQIANLSLWLRAQKSWQNQGVKPKDRPTIRKSNIVCAEPMPGEKQLLEEFIEKNLKSKVLGNLVREIWEKMQLAGEAGSLLKIEEEISTVVEVSKEIWQNIQKKAGSQKELFEDSVQHEQAELEFDFLVLFIFVWVVKEKSIKFLL